jgi:hypothetical protein
MLIMVYQINQKLDLLHWMITKIKTVKVRVAWTLIFDSIKIVLLKKLGFKNKRKQLMTYSFCTRILKRNLKKESHPCSAAPA